jgi:DNA-binding NarL/FixJ family response regulator
MVRQGLRSVLESYDDVDVVGEASNGQEAVSTIEQWKPAVVVMDINMPKKNGIEATTEIKARWPDIIVIGLSVNPGGANSRAMEKAGATLLLTKEAAVVHLYQAIRQALTDNDEAKRKVKC